MVALIAQKFDKFLAINRLMVAILVPLGMKTSIVDKVIGVSDDAGNGGNHMIVDFVNLARLTGRHKKL